MLPIQVLDRFVERSPAVVMVRATLERLLGPERLDQIFGAQHRLAHKRTEGGSGAIATHSAEEINALKIRGHTPIFTAQSNESREVRP